VAFGWLPSGVSPDGGTISAAHAYITAGRRAEWTAAVFAAGRCRSRGARLDCVLDSTSEINYQLTSAAPSVDGLSGRRPRGTLYQHRPRHPP
jgi:hypothetical protein